MPENADFYVEDLIAYAKQPHPRPAPAVDPCIHNVRTLHAAFMKNSHYLTGLSHPGDMFVSLPIKSTQRPFSISCT